MRVLVFKNVKHTLQFVVYEVLTHDVIQHCKVVHLLVNLLKLSLLLRTSISSSTRRQGALTDSVG